MASCETDADGVLVPRHHFDLRSDDSFVKAHVRDCRRRHGGHDGGVVLEVHLLLSQPDWPWAGDCLFDRAVYPGCRQCALFKCAEFLLGPDASGTAWIKTRDKRDVPGEMLKPSHHGCSAGTAQG